MIYVRLFLAIFLFILGGLLALELDFIQSLTPQFAALALTLIIGFTAWYTSRWAATMVLKPFTKLSTKHRAVLITGCDSGFGQLTALALNRLGFFVFAGCFKSDASGSGKKLMKECSFPSRMKVLDLDVTDASKVNNCYEVVTQTIKSEPHVSQLFGLINCAGILKLAETEFGPKEDIDDYVEHMEVNVYGTIRMTKTFLSLIRESKGRIINVSNITARIMTPGFAAYSVSKAALSKFTEGLQLEMSKFGVKVIGVEPWISLSSGKTLIEAINSRWESTPKDVKKSYGKSYVYQLIRFFDVLCRSPFYVEPDRVVNAIIDNLISPEPQAVARVINPIIGLPVWILNDILSWEFVVFIRSWVFWWVFKVLSIEYFVGGRKV